MERLDPADELRFWDADCKLGSDERGIKVELPLGDECGFERLCSVMVVTTEGA